MNDGIIRCNGSLVSLSLSRVEQYCGGSRNAQHEYLQSAMGALSTRPAYPSLSAKIAYWKSLAPKCAVPVCMSFNWAPYTRVRTGAWMRGMCSRGANFHTPYRSDLFLVPGGVSFSQHKLREAHSQFADVVKVYPGSYSEYQELDFFRRPPSVWAGGVALRQGQPTQGIWW